MRTCPKFTFEHPISRKNRFSKKFKNQVPQMMLVLCLQPNSFPDLVCPFRKLSHGRKNHLKPGSIWHNYDIHTPSMTLRQLGVIWAILEPSWAILGPSAPSGGHFGPYFLGSFWDNTIQTHNTNTIQYTVQNNAKKIQHKYTIWDTHTNTHTHTPHTRKHINRHTHTHIHTAPPAPPHAHRVGWVA